MNQLAVSFNFVVTLAYWTASASTSLLESPSAFWTFGLYVSHTLPLIFVLLNTCLSDVRLDKLDVWHFTLVGGPASTLVNLYYSKTLDEPIYPFLTWENWKSPVLSITFILSATACYLITAVIIEHYKGKQI